MRLTRVYRMEKMNKTGPYKWKQVSTGMYLAWRPGPEVDADWNAHTEEQVRQRFAEELTREHAV